MAHKLFRKKFPFLGRETPPNKSSQMDVDKDEKPWTAIRYYEIDQKLGGPFFAKTVAMQNVFVDGRFGQNDENHFPLGAILPSVLRNTTITQVRKCIGKGIAIHRTSEGDVWIESFCEKGVFIWSRRFCLPKEEDDGNEAKKNDGKEVKKISKDTRIKVFDMKQYQAELAGVENDEDPYLAAEKVMWATSIYVSFAKGFGEEYLRVDVTKCPCWIHIQLYDALQLTDPVLQKYVHPRGVISSWS